MPNQKLTPLMQQYFDLKAQYSDAFLFFQVGDFYELFFDDAITASSFLAIALTKRGKINGNDIPLCGVPVHALNHYLVKLIKGGFKVAICDQLTKPVPGKVVERGVTRVLSPGTLTDEAMLDEKSASYLFSLYPGKEHWGLIFSELLTAQLFATAIPAGEYRMLEAELIRFLPDEIVLPEQKKISDIQAFFTKHGYPVSRAQIPENEDIVGPALPTAWLEQQFSNMALARIKKNPSISQTFAVFHHYLKKNNETALTQFKDIRFYQPHDYLLLDSATQKNLEIVKNAHDGKQTNTLFSVVDSACTAMGSRTIKKWLLRPLVEKDAIMQRHEVVKLLVEKIVARKRLEDMLRSCADIERIVGRIALSRAHKHDYLALKNSLKLLHDFRAIVHELKECSLIQAMLTKLADFSSLEKLLEESLYDDPMANQTIKKGFDTELDRLLDLMKNGTQKLHELETRERGKTGINSLKVGYNHVQGYYIEVTNPNLSSVPEYYNSHQKLANRKRFVTEELKVLEHDITRAKTQTDELEKKVYERVKKEVAKSLYELRNLAHILSSIDALQSFATTAYNNNYCMPFFYDSRDILISQGRHPVVERSLSSSFIPNDTRLIDTSSLWILTGPNMGGKSTYLRQVALVSLLAQCGSFVPAQSAHLPILDRIFTRIGAGDDVAQGKSTFLVEMEEAAIICTQATEKSLVILDEVGRGTSTYDGMALAQAIIEYLYVNVKARCLFATHYHELTNLSESHDGIDTYYMNSSQTEQGIVFLHELVRGVAQGSFGLEVAKLAGLPKNVIDRAETLLHTFKTEEKPLQKQISLFPAQTQSSDQKKIADLEKRLAEKDALLKKLSHIDFDNLSPRKAFDILWDLQKKQK